MGKMIDYYSHFPEMARLNSKTASCVITHLKSLCARYGIPEVLMSDNMPFNSRSFCDFANDWNFDLVWSSPRYPQSNGMVERSVQTVKMLLKKAKSEAKDPYIALLVGARRHGQGGGSLAPPWKCCKMFCALVVTVKR